MEKHDLKIVACFLLAANLTACGGSSLPSGPNTFNAQAIRGSAPVNSHKIQRSSTFTKSNSGTYIAINAGGVSDGQWSSDADFNGGLTAHTMNQISTASIVNPAPQAVYQSQRYARSLSYAVPNLVPNTSYTVRLHFAESYFKSAAQRIFGISINGVLVASNFDIFQAAGGANVALVKEFVTTADSTGKIAIVLNASINNASIAGIEIIGTSTPTPTPSPSEAPLNSIVAIDAGGAAAQGWLADSDYSGGWVSTPVTNAINMGGIVNAAPITIYQTQRAGTAFAYSIPNLTPNSSYAVRLTFVESFFASAGQRVFNVTVNGVPVLSGFDIFQAAGGANIAIVKQFSTTADGNGRIAIQFLASKNNASVAGVEILNGGTGPTPTPTPTTTVSPTPAPTPSGGSPVWPAPGWVPYPVSPLTVPVAPNPSYTAGSADIINAMWRNSPSDPGRIQVYSGPPPPDANDYSQPLYFGHASDPLYTVSCYDYGGNCPASGITVHIPKGAYPAGGSDHHIAIRDVATGKDVMLWLAPVPNGLGGAYAVGWGTVISSTGDGLNAIGGSASGLSALWALRETDLEHDTVNHALVVGINGESADGYVYPAIGWDNGYFHSNPWPMMGAHLWLDVPPPYASGCPQYAISYLTALNKYGAYFADNGFLSTPMEASFESDVQYTYNGGASVWGSLMQSLGGRLIGDSNIEINNCGIDMSVHMHILNPPARV